MPDTSSQQVLPIFQSVNQAVHFAFLMEAMETSCESIMSKILRAHLMSLGIWRDNVSTVSFCGLNPMEIRGQCAMIRSAVVNHLPNPYSWALIAKYSLIRFSGSFQNQGAFFTADRSNAIKNLAKYFMPEFDTHIGVLLMLVTRHVCEVRSERPTLQEIAMLYQVSEMTCSRYGKRIASCLNEIEAQAIDRLAEIFERDGLVLKNNACIQC